MLQEAYNKIIRHLEGNKTKSNLTKNEFQPENKNSRKESLDNLRNEAFNFNAQIPQNGYGKFTFGTGVTYEGMWKDGLKHGIGKETDFSGNIIKKGRWKEGVFQEGKKLEEKLTNTESSISIFKTYLDW